MTLLLVRHAVALRRKDWARPDDLRPLSPRGDDQAAALPEVLAEFGVDRILSSPAVRCIDTVRPLATRLGLPVEEVPHLAEGSDDAAKDLLVGLEGTIVACSHGDVVPALLAVLAPETIPDDGDVPCAKGSTWVLDDPGAPRYLQPPR